MMIDLRRILVPIDFNETSEAALRHAVALARPFGARLFLLHVPVHPGAAAEAEYPIGLFETMHSAAYDRLGRLLSEAEMREFIPVFTMRLGKPADEIVRFAAERDMDLIVMGTHGRDGMARMVLGSVAETVVRRAPCPVLTVHRTGHELMADDVAVEARLTA